MRVAAKPENRLWTYPDALAKHSAGLLLGWVIGTAWNVRGMKLRQWRVKRRCVILITALPRKCRHKDKGEQKACQ